MQITILQRLARLDLISSNLLKFRLYACCKGPIAALHFATPSSLPFRIFVNACSTSRHSSASFRRAWLICSFVANLRFLCLLTVRKNGRLFTLLWKVLPKKRMCCTNCQLMTIQHFVSANFAKKGGSLQIYLLSTYSAKGGSLFLCQRNLPLRANRGFGWRSRFTDWIYWYLLDTRRSSHAGLPDELAQLWLVVTD